MLSLAETLWADEYFRTRLKACNYCMQELQRVACNNCTCNHSLTLLSPCNKKSKLQCYRQAHESTALNHQRELNDRTHARTHAPAWTADFKRRARIACVRSQRTVHQELN